MDIVQFINDRLDEDEAVAREAIEQRRQARMDHHQPDYDMQAWPDVSVPTVLVGPERILREVEAKRSIIGRHPEILSICQSDGEAFPCRTLEALVDIYADHRDYDPAWR